MNLLKPTCLILVVLYAAKICDGATVFLGEDIGVGSGGPFTNSGAAEANFLAQTSSVTLVTFDGKSVTQETPLSLTVADLGGIGLSFTGLHANARGLIDNFDLGPSDSYPISGDHLRLNEFGDGEFSIIYRLEFTSPITAFGTYITGGFAPSIGEIELSFDDGAPTSLDLSSPGIDAGGGAQYVGLLFKNPISQLTLALLDEGGNNGIQISLDNLSFGESIPEPTSASLLLLLSSVVTCLRCRTTARRVPNLSDS